MFMISNDMNNTLPYTEGSVWSVQFARTNPGETMAYLTQLKEIWQPIMDEARQRGIILSHRILLSNHTSPNDWDVMIMIELKNMAALDGYRENMESMITELNLRSTRSCSSFLDPNSQYMRLIREVNLT
jgi:hypothetical protein